MKILSKKFYILLFITLVMLAIKVSANDSADQQDARNALTEKYIQTRDHYIKKFENQPFDANNKEIDKAISHLEQYLRTIIGPVKVEGFASQGKINTETLQQDGGFGQMDGLIFYGVPYVNGLPSSYLLVTTKILLSRYVSPRESAPKELQAWPYDEDFYSRVFDWDSAYSNFGELPVHAKDPTSIVHAFLMLSSQDIGPYIPGEIVVFLTKADKIFIINKPFSKSDIKQIPECEAKWNKYEEKAHNLFNKRDFEGYSQYEENGFQAYKKCFAGHLKEQKYFPALKEEAQSIVNSLQKD